MSDLQKLKSCPFCGSEIVMVSEIGYGRQDRFSAWQCVCQMCSARTKVSVESREDAIALWNARVGEDEIVRLRNQDATMLESYRKMNDKYIKIGRLLADWFDGKVDLGSLEAAAIRFASTPESAW